MEFDIMPVLFGIFFAGIVAAVFLLVRHIRRNPIPVKSAMATVTFKSTPGAVCYAVFRLNSGPDSGSHVKLIISAAQYNSLREGDQGELKFKGDRYQDFARKR